MKSWWSTTPERDGAPAIVASWPPGAPFPLRLIEMAKNTGGPATPMNVGIEAARGEYVALLDHDDLMLPEKVGTQTLVLDRYRPWNLSSAISQFLPPQHP